MRFLVLLFALTACQHDSFGPGRVTCRTATLRDNPTMFQHYVIRDANGQVVLEYWICID